MYGDDPETSLDDISLGQVQAQRDVDMPLATDTTYLVVDTNVLLDKLSLLQRFIDDVKPTRHSVLLIIPGAVLNELDKQKKTERLGWFSRRASVWMVKMVKERPSYLRCQRDGETCKVSGNWRVREPSEFGQEQGRLNDRLILDCARFFVRRGRTCLLTGDHNLINEAESNEVKAISPSSSHDLALVLFGRALKEFAAREPDYAGPGSIQDDDAMDVDDDTKVSYEQASDLLHKQVINHFTGLLVALVSRIGGPELEDPATADGGTVASRHAPRWRNYAKPSSEWSAVECLEYLDYRRPGRPRATNPRLDLFLSRPYTTGARIGSLWSYEAWRTALDELRALGEAWGDISIVADVEEVNMHRQIVFRRN